MTDFQHRFILPQGKCHIATGVFRPRSHPLTGKGQSPVGQNELGAIPFDPDEKGVIVPALVDPRTIPTLHGKGRFPKGQRTGRKEADQGQSENSMPFYKRHRKIPPANRG